MPERVAGLVDLWGGSVDGGAARSWEGDTLVHVFSVAKPFAALCLLKLIDLGQVELDAPA